MYLYATLHTAVALPIREKDWSFFVDYSIQHSDDEDGRQEMKKLLIGYVDLGTYK